jgi:ubiquinone/menaquinone biosynthesis C-methylase UbiE
MPADPRFYLSPRLADAYAFHRPPLHAAIWARIVAASPIEEKVIAALDVGCGAGASTAALTAYAQQVTGVDPSEAMLRRARLALPDASFVLGQVEALPLADGTFSLVAAAGSLNYADPAAALREISRVLRPLGRFVAYDFSTGRVDAPGEAASFEIFRESFPSLPGYALDLRVLPYLEHALRLTAWEEFEPHLTMSFDTYLEYVLGETNVEAAIAAGMTEAEARRICGEAFGPLFQGDPRDVRFRAVFVVTQKTAGSIEAAEPVPTSRADFV